MRHWGFILATGIAVVGCGGGSQAAPTTPAATLAPCDAYTAPNRIGVGEEITHLKTEATALEVTSSCTVRVRIAGGSGTLATFTNRVITLRVTHETELGFASKGDLSAIGNSVKPNETFTLSFDSRAFPDGTYPLNVLNRKAP